MLYVKVDANGNPTEVAKNFREIKEEYTVKNTAIPNEGGFSANLSNFSYVEVPESEPLPPKSGSKVVPDVPTKNSDGTMTRTWKYEAATEEEKSLFSGEMKARRSTILSKLIDTISPVRWNSWTTEEQAEVTAWRKALLDLPTTEGWPYVTFPELPAVLKN
jgi:hypothetical protein